jgi:hypothetical protein
MSPNSSLVIADIFHKQSLLSLEKIFSDHKFVMHKKEVITFNVKHALNLDRARV